MHGFYYLWRGRSRLLCLRKQKRPRCIQSGEAPQICPSADVRKRALEILRKDAKKGDVQVGSPGPGRESSIAQLSADATPRGDRGFAATTALPWGAGGRWALRPARGFVSFFWAQIPDTAKSALSPLHSRNTLFPVRVMEEFLSAAPRGKRQKNEANLNFSDDEDEDEPRVPKSSTDDIVEKEIKAEYAKKKAKAEEQRMVLFSNLTTASHSRRPLLLTRDSDR